MIFDFETYLNSVEELLEGGLITVLISSAPSRIIDLAIYVFTALSLYTIAKRRGIEKAWLAWIPLVNVWVLGSISDQYQEAVSGKRNCRRKILLGLNIVMTILIVMLVAAVLFALGEIFLMLLTGISGTEDISNALLMRLGEVLPLFGLISLLFVPMLVAVIVYLVLYFMSLYDVYKSCDPSNATLFTALSFFFNILIPVFLFICRDKDLGMPARRTFCEESWEQ